MKIKFIIVLEVVARGASSLSSERRRTGADQTQRQLAECLEAASSTSSTYPTPAGVQNGRMVTNRVNPVSSYALFSFAQPTPN